MNKIDEIKVLGEIADSKWIWTSDDPDENDVWIYARKKFNVTDVSRAFLHITADLRYYVWINGRPLGFGPAKSHIETPSLDCYPLDSFLNSGQNTITVLVYSFGAEGHITALMPRRGALLASIEVDGQLIPTDASWKVRRESAYKQTNVRTTGDRPFVQQFDARDSLGEPWQPEYEDSGWVQATELSGPVFEPWTSIEKRDIPIINWRNKWPDRITDWGECEYKSGLDYLVNSDLPSEIRYSIRRPSENRVRINRGIAGDADTVTCNSSGLESNKGCYVVYDFGRIWTGYPVVVVRGTPGTVVDISCSEGLTEGRVDPSKQGSKYMDRLIIGDECIRYRISWPKCLRYMQLDVRCGTAVVEDVSMEVSTYPVLRQGHFHSSDPVLDQAWEISAHTLQLCMEDSYMDTPWRERGAWLGDVVPEAHANYYAFGDKALIRRFFIQHAKGQQPDGSMCGKYPGRQSSHIPTWSATYAIALENHVRYTGDIELAYSVWPTVERIGDWLETYRMENGVYGEFPLKVTLTENEYTFIDWSPVDTSGANAGLNAFIFAFWKACGKLAVMMGDNDHAAEYSQKAEQLENSFQRVFWDQDKGVYANGLHNGKLIDRFGYHENLLAVLWDIATGEQRDSIIARFDQFGYKEIFNADPELYEGMIGVAIALNRYPWPSDKPVPLGTPYFGYWFLQGLCELGRTSTALEFIREHWGEFSRVGGSTVWECWNDEGSLSHAWSAAPVVILSKYILGARPTDDPYIWEVFPGRYDLKWASGNIPTPTGTMRIEWRWDGAWHVDIEVPNGLTVRFGLPCRDFRSLSLDGCRVEPAQNVRICGEDYASLVLSEGSHRIETITNPMS